MAAETVAELVTLQAQFFAMVPIRFINFKNVEECEQMQLELLKATVLHPWCRTHPPSISYQRNFLKQMINKLEWARHDVRDELYEVYVALMQREDICPETCCKTYIIKDQWLSLTESIAMISHGTTGLNTWQAGQHLAEWSLENTSLLKNRKILELGSGLGLTGLVIINHCEPLNYTFTDCHQNVLDKLRHNISINSSPHHSPGSSSVWSCHNSSGIQCWKCKQDERVAVLEVDWESVTEETLQTLDFDVVLAADVVYDESVIPSLCRVLRCLLTDGRCCYVASTVRDPRTQLKFTNALDGAGLRVTDVKSPKEELLFYDRTVPIKIIKVTR